MTYEILFGSMKSLITVMASIVLVKYFIYLSLAPFYYLQKALTDFQIKLKVRRGELPASYRPLVSVIIPAWNEAVGIVTTIQSVLANTYDHIEIIIVNDGSTDDTQAVVSQFIKKYNQAPQVGKSILYIQQKNGGKGTALNTGITASHGEIILTMDADSAHHPAAVTRLVNHFKNPDVDAVVGNVKVVNATTLVGIIQKLEYLFGFYFKGVHSLFNAEYIYGGACAGFRKATTFDKIGHFDTQNKTEDIEFSMRTKLHGLKAVYADDVITYTEGASTLTGLYKQRLRWKKGRIDTFVKYRELFFSTHPHHSKFLSWIVLPYAVLGEIQMLLEPMFFTLIWTYSLVTGDFLSVGLSSLFILFTYISVIRAHPKTGWLNIFLFPAFWLLFYVLVAIEFVALIKAMDLVLSKKDIVWQKWARTGISHHLQSTVLA